MSKPPGKAACQLTLSDVDTSVSPTRIGCNGSRGSQRCRVPEQLVYMGNSSELNTHAGVSSTPSNSCPL